MAYTLERFAADCRSALERDPGPAGGKRCEGTSRRRASTRSSWPRTSVRTTTRRAGSSMRTSGSGSASSPTSTGGRARVPLTTTGRAGRSTARRRGVTEMTEWRVVVSREGGAGEARWSPTRIYSMQPGDAQVYQEGDLHSPRREGETRLIRIEGRNLDGVPRSYYDKV